MLVLWRAAAHLDFMFMTRSPRQLLGYLFSDALLSVTAASGTLLLAERFDGIGPWTKHQIVFMLGYAIVAGGVLGALFGYNVLFISRRLGRGQLDHTLIQPRPLMLALLAEGFNPFSSSAELILGLGLMLWAGGQLALPVSPGWLAMLGLNLVASATIIWSFSYLWGSLAFWAPRAAEEISTSALTMMGQLKSFPLDGAGAPLTAGLLSALPVGFVAWYPCRALLGVDPAPHSAIATPLAAAVLLAVALLAFRRGVKEYERTGSQRYSTFGHRR
ncbi:MAG TPA: ABC-2 family transporter protein [Chloroflexota bacterium]|nr:ABC-2 family transporter protein [Chloroflexota bacterium]